LNKEIRRLKLAVNSDCQLRCDYCFIDKELDEVLPADCAEKAIDLALRSPGRSKRLLIYGGEPLLHFAVVERAVLHARASARALGKRLSIAVATNAATAHRGRLEFLRDQGCQLAVSVDGAGSAHDRFRRYRDGRGSFETLRRNLRLILEVMPKKSLAALVGVHPAQAGRFRANFEDVAGLGFENFNIEVIHGVPWSARQLARFDAETGRVFDLVLESIASDRPLFVESTYRELRGEREEGETPLCPFLSCLETYPRGEYAFFPFPFLGSLAERKKVSIGGAREGLSPRYRDCVYAPESALCRGCAGSYYGAAPAFDGGAAMRVRGDRSARFVREFSRRFGGTARGARYVAEAGEREELGFA
jgi:MoaA/NifB/PqqE/SkfB family radical SAM enzyme